MIFLSPGIILLNFYILIIEYLESANNCHEFWEASQYPSKLIIFLIKPVPKSVLEYIEDLELAGATISRGWTEYKI